MFRLGSSHNSSGDMHPAFVKAELAARGLTLTALALRHGKEASYYRSALQKPFHAAFERLARAIGKRPHVVWPSLFDKYDHPIRRRRRGTSSPKATTSASRRA